MSWIQDLLVPRTPPRIENTLPRFTTGVAQIRGGYQLIGQIECSPPERCFAALPIRPMANPPTPSIERPLFVRITSEDELASAARLRARVVAPGLEEIFDITADILGEVRIASRFVHGASVRVIGDALARRRERLPWSLVLAIYLQARTALDAFVPHGLVHGALTAARVRIDAMSYRTVVCTTVTSREPSPRSDRIELARIVLPLAASRGRELALIEGLETADDLLVLRDHLVEQQRASAEMVLSAFDDVGVAPRLPEAEVAALWTWVAGCARVGVT